MSDPAILCGHGEPPNVNKMQEQIGITIRAYDLEGEDLSEIRLPAPVLVRDGTAFEQRLTHEVIVVLQDDDGLLIAAKLRPVRLRAVRR